MLALRTFVLLGLSWTCQAASSDPWGQCSVNRKCKDKFGDGSCDRECMEPKCLRDGFDCLKERGPCNPRHIHYCRDHYASSACEQGCNSGPCGWDGSDCFKHQSPQWAKGTLVLHTKIPHQRGTFSNSSLLWALSVLLQSPLKLRGSAPFASSRNLLDLDPEQLANLLTQASPDDSNGSLLFLQVDNRPCLPSTCFPHATEAASFLRAVMLLRPSSFPTLPDLMVIISIRGVREEIGSREEETVIEEVKEPTPAWLWAVIAIAIGLLLVLSLVVFLVVRRVRQQRAERDSGNRVRHRSTVTDNDPKAKAFPLVPHAAHQEQRVRTSREKDKISLRKKKKAKEAEKKRRREPLGEDAIRMRPLKRDQDIGSDTDFTQSSMEDINVRCSRRQEDASICDHRSQEQKHYRAGNSQTRRPIQRKV